MIKLAFRFGNTRLALADAEGPNSHAELLYHLILSGPTGSCCLFARKKNENTHTESFKWCHQHLMNALVTPALTKSTGSGAAPLCTTASVWISSPCRHLDATSCTVPWLWGCNCGVDEVSLHFDNANISGSSKQSWRSWKIPTNASKMTNKATGPGWQTAKMTKKRKENTHLLSPPGSRTFSQCQ